MIINQKPSFEYDKVEVAKRSPNRFVGAMGDEIKKPKSLLDRERPSQAELQQMQPPSTQDK